MKGADIVSEMSRGKVVFSFEKRARGRWATIGETKPFVISSFPLSHLAAAAHGGVATA